MFASLLLVALFGFALSYGAEANDCTPKCDHNMIHKIYEYWVEQGCIPDHVLEHDIKCHEIETAIKATSLYFPEGTTCAAIHHGAASHCTWFKDSAGEFHGRKAMIYEHHGQIVEPKDKIVRFNIAEKDGVRLTHKCSIHPHAQEGPCQFVIKGPEGCENAEAVAAMEELMCSRFGVSEELCSFETTCCPPEGTDMGYAGGEECKNDECCQEHAA